MSQQKTLHINAEGIKKLEYLVSVNLTYLMPAFWITSLIFSVIAAV